MTRDVEDERKGRIVVHFLDGPFRPALCPPRSQPCADQPPRDNGGVHVIELNGHRVVFLHARPNGIALAQFRLVRPCESRARDDEFAATFPLTAARVLA